MPVVWIILGGSIPLAVAYSLGKLCFRSAPDVIALGVGAVIESLLIFGLLTAGVARPPAFLARAAIGLLPLVVLRPRLKIPAPAGLAAILLAGYGAFYLIHSLAPEIQPDGMSYHLGLVAEYARLGAFPHRVAFFEMLPQGMEMLFLFAFSLGKHSAAKLVDFGFLLATVPLMLELGRRLRLPDRVSSAAAVLYFCAPLVGITGTSTYTDATLVFFTLSALLALLLWKQDRDDRCLLAAGLLAGFCYAIKMSGLLVPLLAVGFVLCSRRARPAMALIPIAPWLIRNTLAAGNPVAPLGDSFFPNPYFHAPMERSLQSEWRNYGGFSLRSAPRELTVGGRLQGNFGPIFLLLPIGLLALRKAEGRWIWLAAALLSLPWLSNAGARFLMPALPFFALAMAMSLYSLAPPMLWVALVIHAVSCAPAVARRYQSADAWKLPPLPWRAALRLESEPDYLARMVWSYRAVDLLQSKTRPGETTFSLLNVPKAYTDRQVVGFWDSALAERIMDTLNIANWRFQTHAEWPPARLRALRFRLMAASPIEWDLAEVSFYSGAARVPASPRWRPGAWPNPWEASSALDGNFASRWRTWEPIRPGMFFEVSFDEPQLLTSAVLATRAPAYGAMPVEFYGLGEDGAWKLLSRDPKPALQVQEYPRRSALAFIKHSGIDYILAPTDGVDVWQFGKKLVEEQREWGLEDVGQRGSLHLLRLPSRPDLLEKID
jgi:Dolichyl-phosphate-mannose-protein mannosyltransferase